MNNKSNNEQQLQRRKEFESQCDAQEDKRIQNNLTLDSQSHIQQNTINYNPKMITPTTPPEEVQKIAIKICKIPYNQRTLDEALTLVQATIKLPFFIAMNSKKSNTKERLHFRCCEKMRYIFYQKGSTLCHYGEFADKFFIILSGAVNIFIPKSEEQLKEDLKAYEQFVIQQKKEEKKKEQQLRKQNKQPTVLIQSETAIQLHNKQNTDIEEHQNQRKIQRSQTIINKQNQNEKAIQIIDPYAHISLQQLGGLIAQEIVDVNRLIKDNIPQFFCAVTLRSGVALGDVGMLRRKPRNATIIAREDCHVAVLMKNDYEDILATVERMKMNDKIFFFQASIFNNSANDLVSKISYSFSKHKYPSQTYIFREGEPCQNVYLIKKGRVQFTKMNQRFKNHFSKLQSQAQKESFRYLSTKPALLSEVGEGYFFGTEQTLDVLAAMLKDHQTLRFNKQNTLQTQQDNVLESEAIASDQINNMVRDFSAICQNDCVIYVCNQMTFIKFLMENPVIRRQIQNEIMAKKAWMDERIRQETFKQAREMKQYQVQNEGQDEEGGMDRKDYALRFNQMAKTEAIKERVQLQRFFDVIGDVSNVFNQKTTLPKANANQQIDEKQQKQKRRKKKVLNEEEQHLENEKIEFQKNIEQGIINLRTITKKHNNLNTISKYREENETNNLNKNHTLINKSQTQIMNTNNNTFNNPVSNKQRPFNIKKLQLGNSFSFNPQQYQDSAKNEQNRLSDAGYATVRHIDNNNNDLILNTTESCFNKLNTNQSEVEQLEELLSLDRDMLQLPVSYIPNTIGKINNINNENKSTKNNKMQQIKMFVSQYKNIQVPNYRQDDTVMQMLPLSSTNVRLRDKLIQIERKYQHLQLFDQDAKNIVSKNAIMESLNGLGKKSKINKRSYEDLLNLQIYAYIMREKPKLALHEHFQELALGNQKEDFQQRRHKHFLGQKTSYNKIVTRIMKKKDAVDLSIRNRLLQEPGGNKRQQMMTSQIDSGMNETSIKMKNFSGITHEQILANETTIKTTKEDEDTKQVQTKQPLIYKQYKLDRNVIQQKYQQLFMQDANNTALKGYDLSAIRNDTILKGSSRDDKAKTDRSHYLHVRINSRQSYHRPANYRQAMQQKIDNTLVKNQFSPLLTVKQQSNKNTLITHNDQ